MEELMSKTFSKKLPLFVVCFMALVLVFTIGFTLTANTVTRAATKSFSTNITVAQQSDIHYFPLDYCFVYTHNEDGSITPVDKTSALFTESDFNLDTYGDTKLVAESGTIMNAWIQHMIKKAKDVANSTSDPNAAILDEIPDILMLTGDLSKNSERVALIDVANAFRYLQNEMRAITLKDSAYRPWENFQVLAVPGNHDIYNYNAAIYDNHTKRDGSSMMTDTLDAAAFAQIFESLGYPEFDAASRLSKNYLGGISRGEEYWSSVYSGGYVESSLAKNLKFIYYSPVLQAISNGDLSASYVDIGHTNNVLSYIVEVFDKDITDPSAKSLDYTFVMVDASARTLTDKIIPVAASSEFVQRPENSFSNRTYYKLDDNFNFVKIESALEFVNMLSLGELVYYNPGYNHLTGGRITTETVAWIGQTLEAIRSDSSVKKYYNDLDKYEDTVFLGAHQNFLPHFAMEDDLLKDFTLYNWEYLTKEFAKMGIRYLFSGHMHTSDIETYADALGRVIYDFQTGSIVSYSSPLRIVYYEREYLNGEDGSKYYGEKAISKLEILDSLKEVASSNIAHAEPWVETGSDFTSRFEANPDYFTYSYLYDSFKNETFNEYISQEIYDRLVDRMVINFISDKMINSLRKSLEGFFEGSFTEMLGGMLAKYGEVANIIVNNLIDQILYNDNLDYSFTHLDGSKTEKFDTALELVRDGLVKSFIELEFGKEGHKLNVKQIVKEIITRHNTGNEIISLDALINPAEDDYYAIAVNDLRKQCVNGKLIEKILYTVLNPLLLDDNSLLKQIYYYGFDLSIGMNEEQLEVANELIEMLVDIVNDLFIEDESAKLSKDIVNLKNFTLNSVLDNAKSTISTLLNDLLGFDMGEKNILEAAEDFVNSYLTESFLTGLGGYVEEIVIAFSVDITPDYDLNAPGSNDIEKLAQPYLLRYTVNRELAGDFATLTVDGNKVAYTYVQGQYVPYQFNIATQLNGRLPSRVTANFNVENSTTAFDINFYTAEDVYGLIEVYDNQGNLIARVSTHDAETTFDKKSFPIENGKQGLLSRKAAVTSNGIKTELTTLTMPTYVPLIDLGVLCLTHSEIIYEVDDAEYYYSSEMRDGVMESGIYTLNNSVIFMNRNTVKITGLAPNTTYKYKLYGVYKEGSELRYFSLSDYIYEVASEHEKADYSALSTSDNYFTFKTAAGADVTKFDFLAITDPQGSIQATYDAAYKALSAIKGSNKFGNYEFILNAGDMVDNGKNYRQWGFALDTMVEFYANTSMFQAAGNHENGSDAFRKYYSYDVPEQDITNGVYFSFDYGNAHFIILNTNDYTNGELGTEQTAWLINDLKNNDKEWTIVTLHKSLYSNGSHAYDKEVVKMREQLGKIFAEYGVDVVLMGHDHTYTSTTFVDANGNTKSIAKDANGYVINGAGVLYMTLGTLGDKFYRYQDNEAIKDVIDAGRSIAKELTSQTFAYFKVDGKTLEIFDCTYDETVEGNIRVFGSIKVSKVYGDVAAATEAIKVDGKPLEFGTLTVKYGKSSVSLEIGSFDGILSDGGYIKLFDANNNEVSGKLAISGGKAVYEARLLDKDGNLISVLGQITLVQENFALYTAIIAVACVVAVAGVAVALALGLRKKKAAPAIETTEEVKAEPIVNDTEVKAEETSVVEEKKEVDPSLGDKITATKAPKDEE